MTTKVLVSFDDDLLRRIDEAARDQSVSRSALLSAYALEALGEPVGPGAHPRAKTAFRNIQRLAERNGFADIEGDDDSTAFIRQMRDSR